MPAILAVPVHANPARTFASASAWIGALLLVSIAPFEAIEPVFRLPWQSVSNVELVIGAAGAVWAAALWLDGDRVWWRTPLTAAWAALLATMVAASLVTPVSRANALHMTARMAVAGGVFLMTASSARSAFRIRTLLEIAAAAGALVAALAILEFLSVGPVLDMLRVFRVDTAVVGEQVRATGTLQYPTIASMYLEIAFAFSLGLLASACDERRTLAAAGWAMALLVIGEGIVLTFTRAGLITIVTSVALVGGVWWKRHGAFNLASGAIAGVAVAVAAEIALSHAPGATRLRMTTEGQDAWYRADIVAPPRLSLESDRTITVPVTLTNTGRVAWSSAVEPPFRLSYHWVMANEDRVVAYEGMRTPFAQPVEPGATVRLNAHVRAPRAPGRYRLLWDVAEEGRLWFTTEPGATLRFSDATVTGRAANVEDPGPLRLLPRPVVRPGRFVLWRAAGRMLAAYPLLGIGPDNFRLSYGAFAGVRNADPRVHTNNMYLEIPVGAGLAGAFAFAWLLWSAVRVFRDLLARTADRRLTPALGVVAAGIAFAVHGGVDSFLGFTPIYVLMAVTLGIAVGGASRSAGESDAYRV